MTPDPDIVEGCDYCGVGAPTACATHRHAGNEYRRRATHLGYRRDRSWYASRPNTSGATKVHRLGPDGLMAACNSRKIMLDVEGSAVLVCEGRNAVPEDHLCRRCYPNGRPPWDAS